ncbi:septal ring lytic transglycosylase RlpA family protein [Pelistega suis]|nr:septal ring lytic transglycosylase RlpA family protein [Pelistega suis]
MIQRLCFLVVGFVCFTASSAQESTSPAHDKTTFRITVNGIFPDSPTNRWASIDMPNQASSDSLFISNTAEESNGDDINLADIVVSADTSALKKDNAPKLRVEPSHARRGKAYTVNGKRYVPFASLKEFSQTGVASWYGPGFHGKRTANGETFNQHALTAAHKELPLNSVVRVTRVSTGKSIVVRINDRGPFHSNRVIDLSYGAAKQLGIVHRGSEKVKIELISKKNSPPTL